MSECTALATKPEVAVVKAEVGQKLNKADEPKIVQKATAGAATLALLALDPRIQALLDELAGLGKTIKDIGSELKVVAGKLFTALDKIAGILSFIGLLATQAQLFILNGEVSLLRRRLEQVESDANYAVEKANIATTQANAATTLANIAVEKSYQAINQAGIANNQSLLAISDARIASGRAEAAVNSANTAIAQSNAAIGEARISRQESNTATVKANIATVQAGTAISDANKAIATSNQDATVLKQVQSDNNLLKAELFGIKFAQSLTKQAIANLRNEVETKFEAVHQTLTVNGVTKEFVVSKVKEVKTTFESTIRDSDGKFVGLESPSATGRGISAASVTQIVNGSIQKQDKSIRDWVLGLPGLGTKGLSESQVKDIARTEAGNRVQELERVNEKQAQGIRDSIASLPVVLAGTIGIGVAQQLKPFELKLSQTVAQTSAPALTNAAAAGVCQSTKPGGCMNNLTNNQTRNIGDYINAAGATASAANNALLLKMQGGPKHSKHKRC
jgi:hypothetical protein